jgi:hypothetical protein
MADTVVQIIWHFAGPLRQFVKCNWRKRYKVGSEDYKQQKRYVHGMARYFEEINIVKILKQARMSKMINRATTAGP